LTFEEPLRTRRGEVRLHLHEKAEIGQVFRKGNKSMGPMRPALGEGGELAGPRDPVPREAGGYVS